MAHDDGHAVVDRASGAGLTTSHRRRHPRLGQHAPPRRACVVSVARPSTIRVTGSCAHTNPVTLSTTMSAGTRAAMRYWVLGGSCRPARPSASRRPLPDGQDLSTPARKTRDRRGLPARPRGSGKRAGRHGSTYRGGHEPRTRPDLLASPARAPPGWRDRCRPRRARAPDLRRVREHFAIRSRRRARRTRSASGVIAHSVPEGVSPASTSSNAPGRRDCARAARPGRSAAPSRAGSGRRATSGPPGRSRSRPGSRSRPRRQRRSSSG